MRCVTVKEPGGPEVLGIADLPEPVARSGQLLVRNFAAGLNRADLLQRRGLYPPPAGESDILGLEFAGEVAAVGDGVEGFSRGDRVFGLCGGGAYADFLVVDECLALEIPPNMSYESAAAVPEAGGEGRHRLLAAEELAVAFKIQLLQIRGLPGKEPPKLQSHRARDAAFPHPELLQPLQAAAGVPEGGRRNRGAGPYGGGSPPGRGGRHNDGSPA